MSEVNAAKLKSEAPASERASSYAKSTAASPRQDGEMSFSSFINQTNEAQAQKNNSAPRFKDSLAPQSSVNDAKAERPAPLQGKKAEIAKRERDENSTPPGKADRQERDNAPLVTKSEAKPSRNDQAEQVEKPTSPDDVKASNPVKEDEQVNQKTETDVKEAISPPLAPVAAMPTPVLAQVFAQTDTISEPLKTERQDAVAVADYRIGDAASPDMTLVASTSANPKVVVDQDLSSASPAGDTTNAKPAYGFKPLGLSLDKSSELISAKADPASQIKVPSSNGVGEPSAQTAASTQDKADNQNALTAAQSDIMMQNQTTKDISIDAGKSPIVENGETRGKTAKSPLVNNDFINGKGVEPSVKFDDSSPLQATPIGRSAAAAPATAADILQTLTLRAVSPDSDAAKVKADASSLAEAAPLPTAQAAPIIIPQANNPVGLVADIQAKINAQIQAPAGHQTVTIEQVPVTIAARAAQGNTQFDIRLDPQDLGRIDVRLQIDREGFIKTHLVVESHETYELLQRDQRQLERTLNQNGMKTGDGSIELSLRSDTSGQQQDRQQAQTQQERQEERQRFNSAQENSRDGEAHAMRNAELTAQTYYSRIAAHRGGVDVRI